jgi:4-hydroxythreonine-4-phosphate dehydrogenase
MGDVNGIGPEVLAKALGRDDVRALCDFLVIGCAAAYEAARQFAPAAPPASVIDTPTAPAVNPDTVAVYEAGVPAPLVRPGELDAQAARAAVTWIQVASQLALQGKTAGLVTCPINKEGLSLAGYTHLGHTELLAEATGVADYRMSLFADTMRIVHISSHLPLAQAVHVVKMDRIAKTIRIAHDALTRLNLPRKRIAVAGLNPHAGEAGLLGYEETREIAPAVRQCQADGIDCSGPYPPDTVFRRMNEGIFDLVVAMYHDQGHIPLKLIAMDEGVNVTLGIPIVRTSVDHGTAYDIAWKGLAHENSLCAAIRLAVQFARP